MKRNTDTNGGSGTDSRDAGTVRTACTNDGRTERPTKENPEPTRTGTKSTACTGIYRGPIDRMLTFPFELPLQMTGVIGSNTGHGRTNSESSQSGTGRDRTNTEESHEDTGARNAADGSLATALMTTTVESVATATRDPCEVLYCLRTGQSSRENREYSTDAGSTTDGSADVSTDVQDGSEGNDEKSTDSHDGVTNSLEKTDEPATPSLGSRADFPSGGETATSTDGVSSSANSDEDAT